VIRALRLVFLLPLVWLPILGFLLLAVPALPWWAWLFAGLFWLLFLRRRHAATGLDGGFGDDGPRFSPVRGGGGF